MRIIFTLIFLTIVSTSLYAQFPGMGAGSNQQMPNGRFYGKIVDSVTGKPIDAASVQLLQMKMDSTTKERKEVVISGMLTQANGDFSLENVPLMGQYKLLVSAIGFDDYTQPVALVDMKAMREAAASGKRPDMSRMLSNLDKDLGNISLQLDQKILSGVTVSSTKPMFQLGIDRKIFNVEKSITATGGSAIDVMRNVPSLNVDIDGNVTLRNASPQIFVDGRPTTLSLEQIPADAIESVEIITNPSAKFDASGGTAGILNIVLKKTKKVGYNGGLRFNLDSRWKIGAGGDINVRQNKVNFFASAMYNQRKSIGTGTTDRLTYGNPNTQLLQSDRSVAEGAFKFARAGFDFFLDNRNTLTVSGIYVNGKFTPYNTSNITIDSLYNPKRTTFQDRFTDAEFEFMNKGGQLSFKHVFPKAGQEWTADATFNKSTNSNLTDIRNVYTDPISSGPARIFQQQQLGSANNDNLTIQTDYVNPIKDNAKFETGIRVAIRNVSSRNDFYFVDPNSGQSTYVRDLSLNYTSTDNVYAAYSTFSNQIKNFGYQLGLRVESSNYLGELPNTKETFDIRFPVSLFPSVFLSQKLEKDQELQINYSRRINRPNFWQLTPFTDYSDSLNIRRGNPGLKPEFTNSFEFSYMKIFKNKDNFLASLYYKNTNALITQFQTKEENVITGKDSVLVSSYINANSSYVTGLELTAKNKLRKWWEVTSNANFYTAKITVDDPNVTQQAQFPSFFIKVNNTFTLPKNFSIQLSGDYQSKTVNPQGQGGRGFGPFGGSQSSAQGFIRPNYGIDVAVRYDFLKGKQATVSLNMNDILRTRVYNSFSSSPAFEQNIFRRRDPQVLRLNLSWRFGKFDASLLKRKNMKGERENMNGASDGMNF